MKLELEISDMKVIETGLMELPIKVAGSTYAKFSAQMQEQQKPEIVKEKTQKKKAE